MLNIVTTTTSDDLSHSSNQLIIDSYKRRILYDSPEGRILLSDGAMESDQESIELNGSALSLKDFNRRYYVYSDTGEVLLVEGFTSGLHLETLEIDGNVVLGWVDNAVNVIPKVKESMLADSEFVEDLAHELAASVTGAKEGSVLKVVNGIAQWVPMYNAEEVAF